MNFITEYSSFILGIIIYFISFSILRLSKLPEGWSNFISFVLCFFVPYFYGNELKSTLGLTDSEIVLTEMVKPIKVYNKLEVSNFKLIKIGLSKKDKSLIINGYDFNKKEFFIEYSVDIKNIGDPIITIDDPNGQLPIGFDEELILRNLDGIEGKEEYLNFGDIKNGTLFDKSGTIIEYSTIKPINTNDSFLCLGKIVLSLENIDNLLSRKYDSYLYISFTGTTKEKYNEPNNGMGFIIKQDNYKIDLSSFISSNSDLIKKYINSK